MTRLIALICALLILAANAVGETEDEAAALAAELLPEYTYLDGAQFDQSAMLLLKDAEGREVFAGCVRDGDEWTVTLSTPLPEAIAVLAHTSPGSTMLNLYNDSIFPMRNPTGDMDCNYTIRLQEDSRWMIETVSTGDSILYFGEEHVESEGRTGGIVYGEMRFSLDITQADWLSLPITLAEAADQMALDDWAVTAQSAVLFDTPHGNSMALYHAGVPLRILEQKDMYYRAAVLGGETEGWFRQDELFIGHDQLDAPLTVLPWKDLTTGGDVQVLGVWLDGRIHVESDNFPTGEGFLTESDFIPADGPVG